jgi:hypothetical protein
MFHLVSLVNALNVANIDILKWYLLILYIKKMDGPRQPQLTIFKTIIYPNFSNFCIIFDLFLLSAKEQLGIPVAL